MYYFYAILDKNDDPIRVAGHQHFREDYGRPPSVEAAIEIGLETHLDATVIEGELARLLFTAISGRWRHEAPDAASAEKAAYARHVLAAYARMEFEVRAKPPVGSHLVPRAARRVLDAAVQFGHCYQPWYGQLRVRGDKRKVIGADDTYQDMTMEPIPVEMWSLYMAQ